MIKGIKTGYSDSVIFLCSSDGISCEQNGQEDTFPQLAKFYNYPQNWQQRNNGTSHYN